MTADPGRGDGKRETPKNTSDKQETNDDAGKKAPRRRRKKPVPIGVALRRQGLGEHEIADAYVGMVTKLKGTERAGTNEKLLVDVLKDCSRYVEAVQQAASGPVQVQLVHNVERPTRKPAAGEATREEKNDTEKDEGG